MHAHSCTISRAGGRSASAWLVSMLVALLCGSSGCGPGTTPAEKDDGPTMATTKPIEPTHPPSSAEELRRRWKLDATEGEFDPPFGRVQKIYLERTRVKDLSPLKGTSVTVLYLNHTPVSDLSPLQGMKLEKLNLSATQVSDISPVKTMTLGTLWLNDTKVKDLSPLKGKSLVSLDVSGTPVSDLSPLAGMASLRRLNIARSAVTDLTPLRGLQLQRLIFDPAKITRGLEIVREMQSITALHTYFPPTARFLQPKEFWDLYDKGELPQPKK